jgi:hypothetical protein
MAEGVVKKERFCEVRKAEVTVTEVYGFHGSGACPVSSALAELHCSAEWECRQSGRYAECRLWEDYEKIFG